MITITVPGRPVPKGRPRMGIRGRRAYMYTPAETRQYEETVGWAARAVMGEPMTGPLWVRLRVYHAAKMDCDNIAKSVLDGLCGVAMGDDDQVHWLEIVKVRAGKAEQRVEISLGPYNGRCQNGD